MENTCFDELFVISSLGDSESYPYVVVVNVRQRHVQPYAIVVAPISQQTKHIVYSFFFICYALTTSISVNFNVLVHNFIIYWFNYEFEFMNLL